MSSNFDIDTLKKYKIASRTFFLKNSLKSDVVLAIFDKNFDKKISSKELASITDEQYEEYINQIKTDDLEEFYKYGELKEFIDDGIISIDELEKKKNQYGLKNRDLEEIKNLKDTSQMTPEELIEELSEYGVDHTSFKDLAKTVDEIREERSNYDKNSKVVDGHIGTYVQTKDNALCTFLAVLETMSDEHIKQMYNQKTDSNGNTYYEITFPQDKGTDHKVIVTEEEIKNMSVTIDGENDTKQEIVGFSTGDADVAMFEMAFVKRFGTDVFFNGGQIETSRKIFAKPEERIRKNTHIEDIKDLENLPKNTTISMLYADEMIEKGVSMLPFSLSDGRSAKFYAGQLLLSDGTAINSNHAMSVRGFDSETKELIVSGNSFNSISELRIPYELLKFFKIAAADNETN